MLAPFSAADTGGKLADYFQPWGQYGVSGGVDIMALTAILGFGKSCTILAYDGINAFNSIYPHRFLPALAEIVPSMVPYVSNLYARTPLKLLFALDGGGLEVIESARGVRQGCAIWALFVTMQAHSRSPRIQSLSTGARSESGFVHR